MSVQKKHNEKQTGVVGRKSIEKISDTIIHADVLDGLAMIPDDSVSLILSSPPYNCGIPYRNHADGMPYEIYLDWLKQVWTECYRVLRPGGRLAINIDSMVNHEEDRIAKNADDTGREYFRPIYSDLCIMNKDIGYNFRCDICWYKHQVVGRATAWGSYQSCSNPIVRRNHEYILVWNKGPWRLDPPEKGVKSDLTAEEFQQWTMSYWPISPETQNRGNHEVPFPVRLARPVIKLYSYPGDTVLDPFVGSGTTAYAASMLNRHYIGIDNDAETVRYARDRIDANVDLFAGMGAEI